MRAGGRGMTDRWMVVCAWSEAFKSGLEEVVLGVEMEGEGGMVVKVESTGAAEFGWIVGGVDGLLRTELNLMERREQRQLENRLVVWVAHKVQVEASKLQCHVRKDNSGGAFMVMMAVNKMVRDMVFAKWREVGGMAHNL